MIMLKWSNGKRLVLLACDGCLSYWNFNSDQGSERGLVKRTSHKGHAEVLEPRARVAQNEPYYNSFVSPIRSPCMPVTILLPNRFTCTGFSFWLERLYAWAGWYYFWPDDSTLAFICFSVCVFLIIVDSHLFRYVSTYSGYRAYRKNVYNRLSGIYAEINRQIDYV